jgi:hypothetical protein
MSNFELIDDYLANRLDAKERETFERQLGNDPALKSEVEIQRQIIEGIKQARVAELKAMLSKVPVSGGGAQIEFSVLRIAAGVIIAGVLTAAAYYYFNPSDFPPIDNAAADVTQSDKVIPKEDKPESSIIEPETEKVGPAATPEDQNEKDKKVKSKEESTKPVVKPKIDLVDPSADLQEDEQPGDEQPSVNNRSDISPAHVQVEMDSSNKKYDFHYQFSDSKLMLYGSFDRSLYEVLEINSGEHAVFLYYKNNFYLLDESKEDITRLTPIQDQTLLKKLRAYRSR